MSFNKDLNCTGYIFSSKVQAREMLKVIKKAILTLSMRSVLFGTLAYWASKGVLRHKSLKSLARITISMFKPIFSIDVNHYPEECDDVILFLRSFDYTCSPLHKYDDKPYSLVCYHPIKTYLARKLIDFNIDLLGCLIL